MKDYQSYFGDGIDLCVEMIPKGQLFRIDEYDGYESIVFKDFLNQNCYNSNQWHYLDMYQILLHKYTMGQIPFSFIDFLLHIKLYNKSRVKPDYIGRWLHRSDWNTNTHKFYFIDEDDYVIFCLMCGQ